VLIIDRSSRAETKNSTLNDQNLWDR